jgi:hypothetical protein
MMFFVFFYALFQLASSSGVCDEKLLLLELK